MNKSPSERNKTFQLKRALKAEDELAECKAKLEIAVELKEFKSNLTDEISQLKAKLAELEGYGWKHVANEWADMATNGIQYMRNVKEGITTFDKALEGLAGNLEHCLEVAAGARELAEREAKLAALEIPPPPHECQTEGEKKAFAFGWWKAMEAKNAELAALEADNIANMQTCSGVIKGLQSELAALEGRQGEPVAYIWHSHVGERSKSLRWSKPTQWDYTTGVDALYLAAGAREAQPMTDTVAQVAGYASPPLVLSVALCAEDIKAIYAWRTAIEAHIKGAREAQPMPPADILALIPKSYEPYEATVWVEPTDLRAGYYEKVSRPFFCHVKFARAVEAHHGIKGARE